MHLSELPSGITIVLDANILIYHFTGTFPSCALLLERVRRRELRGVTSAAVLGEVHHRLMSFEAAQRLGRPTRNLPGFLKRHPELIRGLQRCDAAMESLQRMNLRILPVTARLVQHAVRLSHEFGLLTTDALLIATMRAHHLVHLATNDSDFATVPGITLWRP